MTDARTQALIETLPAMLRFARSLTRDPSAADDLVQDVVVRALERHHRFDESRSYRAWLLALTHNLFIDGWRRGRVRDRAGAALAASAEAWAEPNQEHAVILGETLRAFEALPGDQRAVLHLVVVEGASYAEAAEILGAPIGTVMSRLSRARLALRTPVSSPSANHLKLVSDRDA
jgi:RNA polymerase sigma-70 factor (ECF subfamily)